MPISHRSNRLKLIGTPAVEQLQNGRYQLTINCTTMNSREDWYSSNKARIFPDFGSLESAEMSIDGLSPRKGEAYTDMRLVSVQSSTQQEQYIVTLVYQTLGDSFVQVKDDTVNYIENGLRRVTRQSIAKAGTDFQKTIGSTSITSQIDGETAVTCVLANYEVNDTDSYREVTEVYIQAGTLSEVEDKVGSQLAIVKETFASTPSTPNGYSSASEQVSNFNGIPTRQFRFLKDNVTLSETEDKVGSQLAIVKEVFNGTPSTPSGYSIASEEKSNVDGIPTRRFTFLKNGAILSRTTEERQSGPNSTGKVRIQTVEVFNGTPSSTIGGVKISEQESNVGAIVTTRAVFATGTGEVSRTTETRNKGALTITTVESLGSAGSASGLQIEATTREQDGYTLFRNVFAIGNGEISRTIETRNKGKLTITTVESLGSAGGASGFEIESSQRQENGFTLFRNVFADGDGEISRTVEKRNKDKLTITTVESIGSRVEAPGIIELESTSREENGFTLFRHVKAVGEGEISRTVQERNKGKLTITTVESLGTKIDAAGDTEIETTERQENGFILHRSVKATGDGQVITSTRPGRIAGTTEVTHVSYGTADVPTGVHISQSESQENGYIKFTNTSIQGTIEGVKTTYKDIAQVEVPGEVECTTVAVESGGVSGTIAVPKVTPRRKKTIAATVTIEVQSTPPDTASVAFDLGAISCSVTSTNVALSRGAGNTVSTSSGGTTQSQTGFSQNFGASTRIQTYPGCFLTASSSAGSINYIASESPRVEGNTIVTDTTNSSRDTSCVGTGSASKDGYVETGIIKRNSRPILTALNGTTYYEVITWSVTE